MTFLKKLGGIIATITGIFNGIAPALTKELPQTAGVLQVVSKDLAEIGNEVITIEALGQLKGLSGPDKAKAIGPLVAQILLSSSLVAGKKIANPALFQQGAVEIAGGVADVLNSLHEDAIEGVVTKIS